jgi:hypothetical protein
MLSQLEDSQNRLEAIEARDRALKTAIAEAEARAEAIIKALG